MDLLDHSAIQQITDRLARIEHKLNAILRVVTEEYQVESAKPSPTIESEVIWTNP